jgi:hypothetical protein
MQGLLGDDTTSDFSEPSLGLTKALIDVKTGLLAETGGIQETFLTGTAPTEYAPSEGNRSSTDFLLGQFE